jgi:hypothetical protein
MMLGVAASALVLSACLFDDGFNFQITDRRRAAVLESYPAWWSATEECSGESGELGRVQWYTALGITYDGVYAQGVWLPPHDIVILRGYEEHEPTVRHEMLHDLLEGDGEHEEAAWILCELIDT